MKFVKNYLNHTIIGAVTVIMAVAGIIGLPLSTTELLEKISIAIVLAVSLNMVVGFLGELSLGHAGFMCIGAYVGGKTAILLSGSLGGTSILTIIIALILGAAFSAVCGFIVGLPALRLRGDYLAIVTLAFGEIVKNIFENSAFFGGQTGLKSPQLMGSKRFIVFTIGFILVLATLFVVQNIIKSKHGRAITAIRDNEIAAKSMGINITKYKLMGFVVSAVFAGLAGALYSFTQSNIQAQTFDYNYSIEMLVIVVIGGMTVNGSIISAALITFLNIFLQKNLGGSFAVAKDLIYALILILAVIYRNAPSLKGLREKYNLGNLWRKIFKHHQNPAHIRDDATRWDVVPTKISMDEVLSTDVIIDNTGDNSADIGERGGNK